MLSAAAFRNGGPRRLDAQGGGGRTARAQPPPIGGPGMRARQQQQPPAQVRVPPPQRAPAPRPRRDSAYYYSDDDGDEGDAYERRGTGAGSSTYVRTPSVPRQPPPRESRASFSSAREHREEPNARRQKSANSLRGLWNAARSSSTAREVDDDDDDGDDAPPRQTPRGRSGSLPASAAVPRATYESTPRGGGTGGTPERRPLAQHTRARSAASAPFGYGGNHGDDDEVETTYSPPRGQASAPAAQRSRAYSASASASPSASQPPPQQRERRDSSVFGRLWSRTTSALRTDDEDEDGLIPSPPAYSRPPSAAGAPAPFSASSQSPPVRAPTQPQKQELPPASFGGRNRLATRQRTGSTPLVVANPDPSSSSDEDSQQKKGSVPPLAVRKAAPATGQAARAPQASGPALPATRPPAANNSAPPASTSTRAELLGTRLAPLSKPPPPSTARGSPPVSGVGAARSPSDPGPASRPAQQSASNSTASPARAVSQPNRPGAKEGTPPKHEDDGPAPEPITWIRPMALYPRDQTKQKLKGNGETDERSPFRWLVSGDRSPLEPFLFKSLAPPPRKKASKKVKEKERESPPARAHQQAQSWQQSQPVISMPPAPPVAPQMSQAMYNAAITGHLVPASLAASAPTPFPNISFPFPSSMATMRPILPPVPSAATTALAFSASWAPAMSFTSSSMPPQPPTWPPPAPQPPMMPGMPPMPPPTGTIQPAHGVFPPPFSATLPPPVAQPPPQPSQPPRPQPGTVLTSAPLVTSPGLMEGSQLALASTVSQHAHGAPQQNGSRPTAASGPTLAQGAPAAVPPAPIMSPELIHAPRPVHRALHQLEQMQDDAAAVHPSTPPQDIAKDLGVPVAAATDIAQAVDQDRLPSPKSLSDVSSSQSDSSPTNSPEVLAERPATSAASSESGDASMSGTPPHMSTAVRVVPATPSSPVKPTYPVKQRDEGAKEAQGLEDEADEEAAHAPSGQPPSSLSLSLEWQLPDLGMASSRGGASLPPRLSLDFSGAFVAPAHSSRPGAESKRSTEPSPVLRSPSMPELQSYGHDGEELERETVASTVDQNLERALEDTTSFVQHFSKDDVPSVLFASQDLGHTPRMSRWLAEQGIMPVPVETFASLPLDEGGREAAASQEHLRPGVYRPRTAPPSSLPPPPTPPAASESAHDAWPLPADEVDALIEPPTPTEVGRPANLSMERGRSVSAHVDHDCALFGKEVSRTATTSEDDTPLTSRPGSPQMPQVRLNRARAARKPRPRQRSRESSLGENVAPAPGRAPEPPEVSRQVPTAAVTAPSSAPAEPAASSSPPGRASSALDALGDSDDFLAALRSW